MFLRTSIIQVIFTTKNSFKHLGTGSGIVRKWKKKQKIITACNPKLHSIAAENVLKMQFSIRMCFQSLTRPITKAPVMLTKNVVNFVVKEQAKPRKGLFYKHGNTHNRCWTEANFYLLSAISKWSCVCMMNYLIQCIRLRLVYKIWRNIAV